MKKFLAFLISVSAAATTQARDGHGHKPDAEVGRTADGRLGFIYDLEKEILESFGPPAPLPFLPAQGWIGDDPGWASLDAPEGNLLPLEPGAQIFVEVLSLSPALRMFNPAGGGEILAGQTWQLGETDFDAHPIWVIDQTNSHFDPNQTNWFGEFRLIDLGATSYASSDPMAFAFGIPEPASITMLALGALACFRRNR